MNREEVIKLLDWLRHSGFYLGGMNGWGKYGYSAYAPFTSEDVLSEYELQIDTSDNSTDI